MKTRILLLSFIALSSISAFAQNVPSYVPSNGLVGWWPFNGNANDESGNGNNGTVNGATLTTDRFGLSNKAYGFDGITSGIEINNTLLSNHPSSYTFNFWCKLDTNVMDVHTAGYTVFDDCDNLQWYGKGRFLILGSNYTYPSFNFREDYGNKAEDNNPVFYSWVNYSCFLDSAISRFFLFKNGILLDSANFNSNYYVSGNRVTQIGRCQSPISYNGVDNYTSHWLGKIDDIGIWNRALTQQEITDLYNGTSANAAERNLTTVNVHPNPTSGEITITSNETYLQSYSLYNSLGQLVASGMLNPENTTLSIQELAPGIYTLQLQGEKNTALKIVKE